MKIDRNRIAALIAATSATALSLTAVALAATTGLAPAQAAARLTADYAAANAALMKGDAVTWEEKVGGLSPDFVLMSPFGGEPSRAAEYTPERIGRMGRFFKGGSFEQEVVATYAMGDMIVLATIERSDVEVGDLPRQRWALRVTSVFVRRGSTWSLAHRHADPLVDEISLVEAGRLASGVRL
jgi:ketosteroid isomerase-like protein